MHRFCCWIQSAWITNFQTSPLRNEKFQKTLQSFNFSFADIVDDTKSPWIRGKLTQKVKQQESKVEIWTFHIFHFQQIAIEIESNRQKLKE